MTTQFCSNVKCRAQALGPFGVRPVCMLVLFLAVTTGALRAEESVFMTNTALILRGVYLEPQIIDGRSGYLVKKHDRTILVNEAVFFRLADMPDHVALDPDVPRGHPVGEALRQLRNRCSFDESRGTLTVDGVTYQDGDELDFVVRGLGATARIGFVGTSVHVRLSDTPTLIAQIKRPKAPAIDREQHEADVLQRMFVKAQSVLRHGRFSVRGEHYTYSFPISELGAVRNSLEDIRVRSQQLLSSQIPDRTDSGGYVWDREVVGDLLESSKGGGR